MSDNVICWEFPNNLLHNPPVAEEKHWWIQTVTKLLHPHLDFKNHLLLLYNLHVFITGKYPYHKYKEPLCIQEDFQGLASPSLPPPRQAALPRWWRWWWLWLIIVIFLRVLEICLDTSEAMWEVGALSTSGSGGAGEMLRPWPSVTISDHHWFSMNVDNL